MRYAVLGDIHGNLQALEAVLADIDEQDVDCILCVGDVVGYGARPRECVQLVGERAACVVAGNHDWGTVDAMNLAYFNADARDAIDWTKEQLSEEEMDWLRSLPLSTQHDGLHLVHSTPYGAEFFSYIQTLNDAAMAFRHLEGPLGFVGHSHVPIAFLDTDPIDYFLLAEFPVPSETKMIVNVGSVGQPRDLDCRASYAVYDAATNTMCMQRVEYDIAAAAEAILAAGLPETNAQRLFLGR